MPESDAPRSGSRPPREKPRSPYYKASLALAFVFLALALSLPLWLDRARQPVDRAVLTRDLQSVPAVPISVAAVAPAATSAQGPGTEAAGNPAQPNANCRAYVYARCNALRIRPSDCLPIALDAMRVPVEPALVACREAVEARLVEAAKAAGTGADEASSRSGQSAPLPGEASRPAVDPAAGPGPSGAMAKPDAGAAGQPAGQPAAKDSAPKMSPAEQAQKLAKVLQVLEEFQVGANNYATIPAAQNARLAEIRALVDEVGTEEAKTLYNQLTERYRAQPPPDPNAQVREAQRVETGTTGLVTSGSTPELDRVRSLMNDARKQAGMPAAPPPDPNDALRSRSPSEAAAPSSIEQRP